MVGEQFILILLAALVGGLIGLEREYHDKTAGLRTMILIATGSALFTILSKEVGQGVIGADFDPSRVAASIVAGIGFLGAGAIIKIGMNIRGLTTAASIWLVASLGMGMGTGLVGLTFATTAFVLVVLWLLPFIERKIDQLHEFLEFTIVIYNSHDCERYLLDIFEEESVHYVSINRSKLSDNEREVRIMAKNNPETHVRLAQRLTEAEFVHRFHS
jgi:putative Mg2+ transporter-C (MgtC) family protein